MKIIFMGTPETAVPTLKAIVEKGHEVLLVVTQPDKPKGRSSAPMPTPVKEYALSAGLRVTQPEKLKNNEEFMSLLESLEADFLVVVAYGRILSERVLKSPKKAPINVHFSLLPKYRGAAPVNWAIVNGEADTGVTTMLMDVGLDTGDMLMKAVTPIKRKTTEDLLAELAVTGAELLIETIDTFDTITPEKQNDAEHTYAPMIKKEDGLIDWSKSAEEIERMIRGFQPWPVAYSMLDGQMFKLFAADIAENCDKPAGTIFDITKKSFSVACGRDALIVKELQAEGKKRMPAASFLSGFKLEEGKAFG
ncbi:methionyl-tRNA formyltransferase [Geovibrio thiophilus]|uniref:Methionyl-tRNA formyltransferase n=1 Tax=Geovibrio thiophilus TaxID=139438 RepID=A0A3R5X1I1_9BACT|nr:methionyl-tRNA formyltransferase [Geovibrio thiophilus]QAR32196.1 methionyl-tRNA formyltransferase [Geovibrio thiophilus]